MCAGAGRMRTIAKASPRDFREDLVRVYRDSDSSATQVAKDFSVSSSCLKGWLPIDDRRSASPAPAGPAPNGSDALREANKRLKLSHMRVELGTRCCAPTEVACTAETFS
jgi:transposase